MGGVNEILNKLDNFEKDNLKKEQGIFEADCSFSNWPDNQTFNFAVNKLYHLTDVSDFSHQEHSPLYDIFLNSTDKSIHKWHHYFPIYERHFSRFRNTKCVIVEVGVDNGGSLKMWKKYFGERAEIHGIDIDPKCLKHQDPEHGIYVHIGSQDDDAFMRDLLSAIPKTDVFIDDGGHTVKQQIKTFLSCYPLIGENGVYLCEDLHSNTHPAFYDAHWNFLDFSFKNAALLYAWYRKPYSFAGYMGDAIKDHRQNRTVAAVPLFTAITKGIHFYDSIVVYEKGHVCLPFAERR
ncbi:MAG: hypothetical protein SPL30_10665 [Succinivibrio sp.]|nr:hypothetical protein [Succinivibrio sp.]